MKLQRETRTRSILKTFSWRVLATLITALLVYIFTGELALALSVGGVEFFAKIIAYYVHERTWDRLGYGIRSLEPKVLWFTGLSGAGKSTLANETYKQLVKRGLRVELLDGDSIRKIFPQTGFSQEERETHIRRVGYLASRLEAQGVFVIAAFISPYRESRDFVRQLCSNFVEIHVSTSLEACEKRDPKGLYSKARSGTIPEFTGVSAPYEVPLHPELKIDTSRETLPESTSRILEYLEKEWVYAPSKFSPPTALETSESS